MTRGTVLLALALAACAQAPTRPVLRVCADPNNLPFSNRAEQGFENRLAHMVAHDLGAELRYVWWAQRRGNLRETLKAGRCDLVPGVGSTLEGIATSTPYYRSTYTAVARAGEPAIASFDDPRLTRLRIGVQLVGDDGVNTPPAHALTRRGMVENIRGYMVQGDYSRARPQDAILDDLLAGRLDLAYVWGPLAGDYARRHPGQVIVAPVSPPFDGPGLPMSFDVSMGLRRTDTTLRARVDRILERRRAAIERLLRGYGVPLVSIG